MKKIIKNRLVFAFTMLELVFVIVVIGIISAMIAPNFQGNSLREAADQVVSHIRYTQHLAMMDDKFDNNVSQWYQERWFIAFADDSNHPTNKIYYIMSDGDRDNGISDKEEYAKNTLNKNHILSGDSSFDDNGTTKELDLTSKYGITSVSHCRIFFDYIGRPYIDTSSPFAQATSPYQYLLRNRYDLNISDGTKTVTISIEPETGYAYIAEN